MLSFHDVEMNFRQETQNVLSIFNNEARMKRVDLQLTFGDTLDQLGIELIKTDPVRLGQVITNLTSNAIRFTTQSEVRKIMVHAEAAWEPPAPGSCALPAKRDVRNPNPSSGETPVYIYVSVTDTGPGIKNSEQKVLFNSFHREWAYQRRC